jgi:hypothetical protein
MTKLYLIKLDFCFFNLIHLSLPPMSLTANIRYDKLASAFENFNGYHCETTDQISDALKKALSHKDKPSIINIAINPSADRKAQVSFFCFKKLTPEI